MKRVRNLLLGCFGLFIILSLSTPVFPLTISGYSDIGLGVENPLGSGSTQAGTGEYGNFVYITFTADAPIQLTKTTLDFTGKDVEWSGGIHFVPTVQDGVTSFSLFPANPSQVQAFGFTAVGFDSSDFLFYGMDLDKPSFPHSGTPLGTDYIGGTVTVEFSGGTDIVGTFGPFDPNVVPLSLFNARATFSFSSDGNGEVPGGKVPEPATMILLGSGLIGLAGYGRKKFFKK